MRWGVLASHSSKGRPCWQAEVRNKALTGSLAGLWRYRAGDYRIVCDIEDDVLVVLVVDVAHRREVYRRAEA